MKLHEGAPFWLLLHGLRTTVPPLTADTRCDVAVIGSGVVGAMLASELASAGANVVLVDRRDLAQGSTAASTALLLYELDVPLHKLTALLGQEAARRAYRIGIESLDHLEQLAADVGTPFVRAPSIYFTTRPADIAELRAEHEARVSAGLHPSWADAPELRERFGVHAEGATISEQGATIDPYDLTHRLLARAASHGARIHDRTPIARIQREHDGFALTTDRNVTLRCTQLVHATGYEAATHLPPGTVALRSTFAVVSEPIDAPPMHARAMLWEYADPYIYARWFGDRLLVGGEDITFRNDAHLKRRIPRRAARLAGRVRTLLPGIPFEPAFAWSGTFGTTPDGLGYAGSPNDRPNEYFALGFGGNGITLGSFAARTIAATILNKPIDTPAAALFRFGRHHNPNPRDHAESASQQAHALQS